MVAGILSIGLALAGCGPKILPGGSGDDSAASSEGDGAGQSSADGTEGKDSGGDTGEVVTGSATGGETTSGGSSTGIDGTESEGAGSSGGGSDVPEACLDVEHQACWNAVIEACDGDGGHWDISQACVDAVQACYPAGPQVLAPADVISACAAEFDSRCLEEDLPGCSETFCACTAGGFPYDWSSCWHVLMLACRYGIASDCEAALAGCYPGATVAEYEQCAQQTLEVVDHDCDCPMCGFHEQCEDALEACLGV